MNQDFLTLQEVAEYLRVPKGTLYRWTCLKKIPHFKVGRRCLFRRAEVDAWIQARVVSQ